MRLFTLSVCLLLLSTRLPAQTARFGNEWINYDQQYYKIPIAQPGLYRITYTDLQKAGFPVTTIDPTILQLFHRGLEQAITVAGEADKRFDPSDYIEFYGRGNDGAQDSLLYRPAGAQPHKYYSLFSDTTAYFLTYQPGKPGKRMAVSADTDFTGLTPEPYHWAEELRVFTDTYPAGNIYPMGAGYSDGSILSGYDVGEGWSGPVIKSNTSYSQTFTLTNYFASELSKPLVRVLVVGRTAFNHTVAFSVGPASGSLRRLAAVPFTNYTHQRFNAELNLSDLSPAGHVVLDVSPQEEGEEVSVSVIQVRYPQRTDLAGTSAKLLRLRTNPAGRSQLVLTNVAAGSRVFDLTDPNAVGILEGQLTAGRWQGVIRQTQTERTLLVTSQILPIPPIQPVTLRSVDPKKHNYLMVTHPLLRQPAGGIADPVQAYAMYRASAAGGGYDTLTVTINQLFDQFSYGERTPLAIRRFADYMLAKGNPQFLFLIGQSRDPQGVRKNPAIATLDMVPNAGWPGSDLGLVEGLNGFPQNVPAIPIGRLNAGRPQQVIDYLNKVKEHENTGVPALWRKDILHLSGGRSSYELSEFRRYVDEFKQLVEKPYIGGRVTTVSKQTDEPVETIPIADPVNRGVGMISMFGHSSLDITDIDIGFVSNDRLGYRNKGRYPFLLVNGCAAGNFYFGRPTIGTDWILTPDRGAVLFLAHTYNGFPYFLKTYSDQLYALLSDSAYLARPIGQLQQETIRRYLAGNNTIYDITNAQQITLQGDPAVSVFPFPRPDFGIDAGGLTLTGSKGGPVSSQTDSVKLTGIITNYGRVANGPLVIRVRQFSEQGLLLHEQSVSIPATYYADTVQFVLPNQKNAIRSLYYEVELDPDQHFSEMNRHNNRAQISTSGAVTELPFPADVIPPVLEVAFDGVRIRNNDIVSARPTIDVWLQDENRRLLRSDTTGIDLYVQAPCAKAPCPYKRLSLRSPQTTWTPAGADNLFTLTYRLQTALADGQYQFEVHARDLSGNRAAPYRIQFRVVNEPKILAAGAYPNPFAWQTRFLLTATGEQSPGAITIRITDPTGRLVRVLRMVGRVGTNEIFWDGTSETGNRLPNGLYLYQIAIEVGASPLPVEPDLSLTGKVIIAR
ncbi:type IX secretion system sortase PorU [Nibrella viscosa]|uniref:Type IX secretion system sortase PorU n=2 Tax=Nibrella viscosa TaxID=1084524 RepID=A0ABP8JX98_9BACT